MAASVTRSAQAPLPLPPQGGGGGGAIAAGEMGTSKRVVFITGEGSLQLTVQVFSILNRDGSMA